jgi:hypothetical protein
MMGQVCSAFGDESTYSLVGILEGRNPVKAAECKFFHLRSLLSERGRLIAGD